MALPRSLRVNVNVPFPSQVTGSGPVTIAKQNGVWTVGLQITNLGKVPNGTPLSNQEVMIYNTATNTFQQTTLQTVANSIIYVGNFGAVGDGVTDDTVAIQAAINYANGLGGGVVSLGPGRYLINSANLNISQGVFLEGFWEHLGERTNDDYSQLPCVLLLNPTYTVQIAGRDAGIRGVAIINKTLTTPTTLRNILDGVNSFSGTGITVGNGTTNSASDFYLGHLFIMGFAQGIHINGNQERPRVEYIAMDNTAGYLSDGCSDVGGISQIRCWPYFGAHLNVTMTFAVSNAVNNGSGLIRLTCASHTFVTGDVVVVNGLTGTTEANGRWTVTVINNTTLDLQGSTFSNAYVSGGTVYARNYARNGAAFDFVGTGGGFNAFYNLGSYGYDIGIKIEGGDDYDNLIGCWNDNNLAADDPTTIGVWILNSGAVAVSNHTFSSQGTALKIDVSGRSVNRSFISDSRIFGNRIFTAQIINGTAHFANCTFGNAPIRSESTAGQSLFINCDLSTAQFSYGSQATPRANIIGCVTAGNVGQFQPTGQTDQASTVIAKWSGPGRATPANSDNITQQYFMMNSAGNMVQIQTDHHRLNNVTAGSETSEYYLTLMNAGASNDYYSWTAAQFQPLSSAAPNLGGSGAANRWGTFFGAGVNANSPSVGVGYATGAGGAVTQATSRTTGVTLNNVTGAITLFSAAGSATAATFTVTNSAVAATDVIHVCQKSGTNLYNTLVTAVAAGSFNITFFTTGGTATDAPVFNYVVIKGAAS